MENPYVTFLSVVVILRSAFAILSCYSFIITTFLISLPFFLGQLALISLLPALPYHFSLIFLHAWFIYVLKFLIIIMSVHSASRIHTMKPVIPTVGQLLTNSISQTRQMGFIWPYFNFSMVTILSFIACLLLHFLVKCIPIGYSKNRFINDLIGITSEAVEVVWSGYRTIWNLSVIVSILEGSKTFRAFFTAAGLMNGNTIRGMILVGLCKLPTTFLTLSGSAFAVKECFEFVIESTVLVAYYYDCRSRQQGIEEDIGNEERTP